jgi:hypothetical protein
MTDDNIIRCVVIRHQRKTALRIFESFSFSIQAATTAATATPLGRRALPVV